MITISYYLKNKIFIAVGVTLLTITTLLFMANSKVQAAPATFTVTNTNPTGVGSLAQAISDANGNGNPSDQDIIEFNISGSGNKIIIPTSQLTISQSVVIDGYTQGDSTANTLVWPDPFNGILRVQIDNSSSGAIQITSDDVTVKGLVISNGATGNIDVISSDNFKLYGSYLDTENDGLTRKKGDSDTDSLTILNSSNADIGGALAEQRNIFGYCGLQCIKADGASTTDLTIQGNYIGLGSDGITPLAKTKLSGTGISLLGGASNILIGGGSTGQGNSIENNMRGAISAQDVSDLSIYGNRILLNFRQDAWGGGSSAGGIFFGGVTNSAIGSQADGEGNIIAGITDGTIVVANSTITSAVSSNITVENNHIGVMDDSGTAFENTTGIDIYGGAHHISFTDNYIGNTTSYYGVSIKQNAHHIDITQNKIKDNDGILVSGNSNNNTIVNNNISSITHDKPAITIDSSASTTSISGNDITGSEGILLTEFVNQIEIDDNTLGNTNNNKPAITINSTVATVDITQNTITNNYGIYASGSANGIAIINNTIEDTTSNVPAIIFDQNTTSSSIRQNLIKNTGGVNLKENAQKIFIEDNNINSNASAGIYLNDNAQLIAIQSNSIYNNSGLGIDLGGNGVTANDTNDADSGPNGLLNYAKDITYEITGSNTKLRYNLDVPSGNYRIEFFSNTNPDPSGYGEGETFMGYQNITHTGSGSEEFEYTLSGTSFSNITSTTTGVDGSTPSGFGATSEFSAIATEYIPPPVVDLGSSVTLLNPQDAAIGANLNYEIKLTNYGSSSIDIGPFDNSLMGSNSILSLFMPTDLTFVSNSGGNIVCSSLGPGSAMFFGPILADHTDHESAFCGYTGGSTILNPGENITTTVTLQVTGSSDLVFDFYVSSALQEYDPEFEYITNLYTSGDDILTTYLTSYPPNNFSQATFPIRNLGITKELLNTENINLEIGSQLTYRFTLSNNGYHAIDLSNYDGSTMNIFETALFVDVLPSGLAYNSVSDGSINCVWAGAGSAALANPILANHQNYSLLYCLYPSSIILQPNESIQFEITVDITDNPGTNFNNYAIGAFGVPSANDSDYLPLRRAFVSGSQGGQTDYIDELMRENNGVGDSFSVANYTKPNDPGGDDNPGDDESNNESNNESISSTNQNSNKSSSGNNLINTGTTSLLFIIIGLLIIMGGVTTLHHRKKDEKNIQSQD